jgi:hypothetical protein
MHIILSLVLNLSKPINLATRVFEGWAKRVMINNAHRNLKTYGFFEYCDNLAEDDITIDDEPIALETLQKNGTRISDQYR